MALFIVWTHGQIGVLLNPIENREWYKISIDCLKSKSKRLSIKWQILCDGKVGQPLAALPLYGCRIPLAGEGCARKTQEGETGEVPPMEISATERKGVCGKPKRGVPHH